VVSAIGAAGSRTRTSEVLRALFCFCIDHHNCQKISAAFNAGTKNLLMQCVGNWTQRNWLIDRWNQQQASVKISEAYICWGYGRHCAGLKAINSKPAVIDTENGSTNIPHSCVCCPFPSLGASVPTLSPLGLAALEWS
jgi:hypothetical protein